MEILFEILGEFVLQALGELLFELGLRSLAAPFQRDSSPWFAGLGYFFLGCLAGGVSLLVVAQHLTPAGAPRLANLVLTPLMAGLLMALLGRWRGRRGDRLLRIDRFAYGYLFAIGLAIIRFVFAR